MWIARDKNGLLWLFNSNKPIRGLHYDTETDTYTDEYDNWLCGSSDGIEDYNVMEDIIQLPSSLFPDLKWENEPLEVELSLINRRVCDNCGYSYVYHDSDIIDESEPEKENFWIYTECPECGCHNSL